MSAYTFIGPFRQVLTLAGLPAKGALSDEQLPVVEDAAILLRGEIIHAIGPYTELLAEAGELGAGIIQLDGDHVALPGFIDAHTHLCFAGSRARDYALRNSGKSYLDIARAGGGIWDTVTQTRRASEEVLVQGIVQRVRRHLSEGVTTIEVKSGYGLSVEEELKQLRAIQGAAALVEADLIPTCLAAHILPRDFAGDHAAYLDWISRELFPILQKEHLATRLDAFIEEEAFSPAVIAPYFQAAKAAGFDLTVHADQFHPGGSEVAVRFGALSADHLEASTEEDVARLAASSVTAVALPGASLGLGVSFTPARRLLDAGAALAIASDWNPGSAPMGDLLLQAAVLGTFEKLTNAEVLAGITVRAAAALRLPDRGSLQAGLLADINVFATDHYREILYHQGKLQPSGVWKRGERII